MKKTDCEESAQYKGKRNSSFSTMECSGCVIAVHCCFASNSRVQLAFAWQDGVIYMCVHFSSIWQAHLANVHSHCSQMEQVHGAKQAVAQ